MIQIRIDLVNCNGCGCCVQGCPMGVFALEGEKARVSSLEDCIVCKYCETVCQSSLIQVKD